MPNADSPAECNDGIFVGWGLSYSSVGTCYKNTSYANHFISDFYDLNPDNTLKGPKDKSTFVTWYASTGLEDDMAESFQYYIRMPGTPIKDSSNPLSAQNKVALFEDFPEARELKRHFRSLYPNMQPASNVITPYSPQASASQP